MPASIAPLVAGVARRLASLAVSAPPVTFPVTLLGHLVEIAPGADLTADPSTWTWVDITAWCRAAGGIRTTRGRPDEASTVPPSNCQLIVNNTAGDFVIDNPYGTWYPDLDIGTPLRVSVNPGSGLARRFTGRIYDLPPRWDPSEIDSTVAITAQGVLRSLRQGTPVAADPISTTTVTASPIAWWPCTDAASATSIASGLPGGARATLEGGVAHHLHEVAGPDGVSLYPGMDPGGGLIRGSVPTTTSTSWTVTAILKCDTLSFDSDMIKWTTGRLWFLRYNSAGTVAILSSPDGDTLETTVCSASVSVEDNAWHTVRCSAVTSGANIAVSMYVDNVLKATGTVASVTNTKVTQVTGGDVPTASDGIQAIGQITVYDTDNPTTLTSSSTSGQAATGYLGEQAPVRFNRLLAAAGYAVAPAAWHGVPMGAQSTSTLPELLDECADAEIGVITDTVDGQFDLHTRSRRENAEVTLALDHDSGHLTDNFGPASDDRLLRNRWTLTREGGDSVTEEDAASIAKRGPYVDSKTVSVQTDDLLSPLTQWRLHLGTAGGLRHPLITVNLAAHPELIPAVLACDISSRITIDNPSPGLAPDQIDVLVEQITELIDPGAGVWQVAFATSPFAPWRVGVWSGPVGDAGKWSGRWDWDTVVLAEDLDTTETAVDITATPLLATGPAEYALNPPLWIRVGGERMRVTDCSGVANPQTLTVVRSVNTVVKSHPAGRAVVMDVFSGLVLGS
jgi:hypothetical protein